MADPTGEIDRNTKACVDALHGSRALLRLNCPVGGGFVFGLFARPHCRWPRWVSASRSSHFNFALNARSLARAICGCWSNRGSILSFVLAFLKRPMPLID